MTEETWSEVGLVTLTLDGGSDVEFYTITNSIEIAVGDKDVDFMPMINGGRLASFKPQADTTITLEMYPVQAGTDTGLVGKGVADLLGTADASQPLSIPFSRTRTKCRATLLWTDDTTVTTATAAINLNQTGMRIIANNCYVINASPSGAFTPNDPQKWKVVLKCGAFNKDGTSNVSVTSTDGTATMTMATYTAS